MEILYFPSFSSTYWFLYLARYFKVFYLQSTNYYLITLNTKKFFLIVPNRSMCRLWHLITWWNPSPYLSTIHFFVLFAELFTFLLAIENMVGIAASQSYYIIHSDTLIFLTNEPFQHSGIPGHIFIVDISFPWHLPNFNYPNYPFAQPGNASGAIFLLPINSFLKYNTRKLLCDSEISLQKVFKFLSDAKLYLFLQIKLPHLRTCLYSNCCTRHSLIIRKKKTWNLIIFWPLN